MAGERYFVLGGDREKGPYTVEQLREAVEHTAISDQAMVRLDGAETTETLADLLRRVPPPDHGKMRRGRRIAGVEVDIPDSPESERSFKEREGDYGLGIALGFFGGCIALVLSGMAKPKTRQGIFTGFLIQLVIGVMLQILRYAAEH